MLLQPDVVSGGAQPRSIHCKRHPDECANAIKPAIRPQLVDGAASNATGEQHPLTLVVGLIDYCRQFAWKEEVESRIKRATVIQPKQYKRRFREALHRYFMASIAKYE